jgi:hypothetical protein
VAGCKSSQIPAEWDQIGPALKALAPFWTCQTTFAANPSDAWETVPCLTEVSANGTSWSQESRHSLLRLVSIDGSRQLGFSLMSFCSILGLIIRSVAAVSDTDANNSIRRPQHRIWRDNRVVSNNPDSVQNVGWVRIPTPKFKVGWSTSGKIISLRFRSCRPDAPLGRQNEYLFPAIICAYEI